MRFRDSVGAYEDPNQGLVIFGGMHKFMYATEVAVINLNSGDVHNINHCKMFGYFPDIRVIAQVHCETSPPLFVISKVNYDRILILRPL